MASAMRLAAHPLFNGSDKGVADAPQLEQCNLILSTNVTRADLSGRRATLRVEGTVQGSPPDLRRHCLLRFGARWRLSRADGHHRAGFARTVRDRSQRPGPLRLGDLRVEFCHANGAVSTSAAHVQP